MVETKELEKAIKNIKQELIIKIGILSEVEDMSKYSELIKEVDYLTLSVNALELQVKSINNSKSKYPVIEIGTELSVKDCLCIMRNHLNLVSNVYRKKNANWVIVKDLFRLHTLTGGSTSSVLMCEEMGIDPYGYDLEIKGVAV